MNKRFICLFLYFLVPLMVAIPPVYAAITPTVVYPNGGEVLAGTTDLIFTVADSTNNQTLSADLNFNYSAFGSDGYSIANDLNLFSVCTFPRGNVYSSYNLASIPSGDTDARYLSLGQLDANLILFVLNKNTKTLSSYYFNGTDWLASAVSAGFPSGAETYYSFDFFKMGSDYYLAVDTATTVNIYDWNGFGWTYNASKSFVNPGDALDEIRFFNYNGANYLIARGLSGADPPAYSWKWNGTTWQSYSFFVSNLQDFTDNQSRFDVFVDNDNLLQLVYSVPELVTNVYGLAFDLASGVWVSNNTYSSGLNIDPTQAASRWITIGQFNGSDYVYIYRYILGDLLFYKLGQNAYKTSTASTCSYSVDTSIMQNGLYSFDVNVTNGANLSATDSSSAKFHILNWTDSDIKCDCVSNCSSCVLDVNSFVVTPTNESNDIQIKITNFGAPKNVGYKIRNSDNSGKQYKIFTGDDGTAWDFDDGLTFGSTAYDSVQKIWKTNLSKYEYFFDDTILTGETNYYKFNYYHPAYHYSTVNDSDWLNQIPPAPTDYNGINSDVFYVSTWSDLSSFLKEYKFPAVTSGIPSTNFVFQFTAKGDSAITGELKAGVVAESGQVPSTAFNLTTGFTTLKLDNISDGYLKIASAASASREMWFQNYVISERGYFTDSIEVLDSDGSHLPVMVGDSNTYYSYVIEGKNFRVKSQYYDPDGKIDRVEISAYIDAVVAANRLKKWVFDASGTGFVSIDETIGGLIDLTANAPDRDVKITIRLIDTNSNYFEIQSKIITLRQFPKTARDLFLGIINNNQLVGDHPKGHITLETIAPENVVGVNVRIFDSNPDSNSADFNKVFYKNTDFQCFFEDCSFDFELADYVFPMSDNFRIEVWALVTTEEQSNAYGLLHIFMVVPVSWISFDTARIFQVYERSDLTYTNNEVIPLVVQLRDSTGFPVKNKVKVTLQLKECNANKANGGQCRDIDLNYMPDSYLFDEKTGYNYYFFRQMFLEEDYLPLSDGNYFRFKAIIEDYTKTYNLVYQPTLANKCQVLDPLTFWANMLTMNFFNWGCDSGQFTSLIVSLPDSNSQEERLLIDAGHSRTAPTQYWWMCFEPDVNNVYMDVLAKDEYCFVFYLLGEQPIDKFKFYLTNKYSDLGETKYKQFIEAEVPFEYIYVNDMQLLKEALRVGYKTDWSATHLPNVGDVIYLIGDYFLGASAPLINVAGNALSASGLIGNMGFTMGAVDSGNATDFNFNTPLDPRTLSGILIYRVRGLNVVNKKDFETAYPETASILPNRFYKYAVQNKIPLYNKKITVDVFVSDFVKILSIDSNAVLVIDESPNTTAVNRANVDINSRINYSTVPTLITFNAISDLVYNSAQTFKRRYLILPYRIVITSKQQLCIGSLCLPDYSWFIANWFMLLMLMIGILFISVVYSNFRGGGSSINIFHRNEW